MKKRNPKCLSIVLVLILACFYSCQVDENLSEPESLEQNELAEELISKRKGEEKNCTPAGNNSNKNADISNPVNKGTVDDRSCYANYTESRVGNTTYGNYNIKTGSNHLDSSTLQPRIERVFPRSNDKIGSYVEFKGTVRILEVGNTSNDNNDGTYIAQAKGKHTGGGGPNDPAICLFLAKPVYGRDAQGRFTQTSFNIYREQITFRGATASADRRIVFLKNVKKGRATSFTLKVGFRNNNGRKVHYANASIGGTNYFWNIPEPNRGTQSGIRYGAYRVKGGRARIQWANTTFKKVDK